MHRGSGFLIAGLLLAGVGCAHGGGVVTHAGEAQPADTTVQLNVTNHYTLPMEIYATGSGTTYHMGTVAPGIDRQFVLRRAVLGNGVIEFTAQPSGLGPIVRSGELLLVPGDVVDFEIATFLYNSRAVVRPQ